MHIIFLAILGIGTIALGRGLYGTIKRARPHTGVLTISVLSILGLFFAATLLMAFGIL